MTRMVGAALLCHAAATTVPRRRLLSRHGDHCLASVIVVIDPPFLGKGTDDTWFMFIGRRCPPSSGGGDKCRYPRVPAPSYAMSYPKYGLRSRKALSAFLEWR